MQVDSLIRDEPSRAITADKQSAGAKRRVVQRRQRTSGVVAGNRHKSSAMSRGRSPVGWSWRLVLAVGCLSATIQELPASIQCQEMAGDGRPASPGERYSNIAKLDPAIPSWFERSKRAALLASAELRAVAGSKSEPPSRPSQDWSKQKPYFGPDMTNNVSVDLGKTAYLTCKVFELGDKTVSWLKPRENEILTAGRYTYIGDPRFTSINEHGSPDWVLEIKDVGLNDSTSYECQVSTDPKMSAIINLHVKGYPSKNGSRSHPSYQSSRQQQEAQRNNRHYNPDMAPMNSESADSSGFRCTKTPLTTLVTQLIGSFVTLFLLSHLRNQPPMDLNIP